MRRDPVVVGVHEGDVLAESGPGVPLGEVPPAAHLLGVPDVRDLLVGIGSAVAPVLAEHGPGSEAGVPSSGLVADDGAGFSFHAVGHDHLRHAVPVDVPHRRGVEDLRPGVLNEDGVPVGVEAYYRHALSDERVHAAVAVDVGDDGGPQLVAPVMLGAPLEPAVVLPAVQPVVVAAAQHLEEAVAVDVGYGGRGEDVVLGVHRPPGEVLAPVIEGVDVLAVGIGQVGGLARVMVLPVVARAHDDVGEAVAVEVRDGGRGPHHLRDALGKPGLYGAVALEDVEEPAARVPAGAAPAVGPDDHLVLPVQVDVLAGGRGPHGVAVVELPGHGPLVMPGGDVMPPASHHDLQVTVAIEVAAGRGGEDLLVAVGRAGVLGPPPVGEGLTQEVDPVHVAAVAADEDLQRAVAVAVHGAGGGLYATSRIVRPPQGPVGVNAVNDAVLVPGDYLLDAVAVYVRYGGRGVLERGAYVHLPFRPPPGWGGGLGGPRRCLQHKGREEYERKYGKKSKPFSRHPDRSAHELYPPFRLPAFAPPAAPWRNVFPGIPLRNAIFAISVRAF